MATTKLKAASGKYYEFNAAALVQLQKEAKQAYKDCEELARLTKGKSLTKAWQIENALIKAGKLVAGTIFQVTKKELCISFKKNLLNGSFAGHKFQMQVLESFGGVPAGEIFKW